MVKKRATGRVVEVCTPLVFGTQEAVAACWAPSPVSHTGNTSFVARHHLTQRQRHRCLPYRTPGFSKDLLWFEKHGQFAKLISTSLLQLYAGVPPFLTSMSDPRQRQTVKYLG